VSITGLLPFRTSVWAADRGESDKSVSGIVVRGVMGGRVESASLRLSGGRRTLVHIQLKQS
jgi:hypothetical protein